MPPSTTATRPRLGLHIGICILFRLISTFSSISVASAQAPSTSSASTPLWGSAGETWDRDRLMDWSFSGYAGKERPPTEPPFAANVLDFGAIGDGRTDSSEALRAAIDQVRL